jgi:hypothetical protein
MAWFPKGESEYIKLPGMEPFLVPVRITVVRMNPIVTSPGSFGPCMGMQRHPN